MDNSILTQDGQLKDEQPFHEEDESNMDFEETPSPAATPSIHFETDNEEDEKDYPDVQLSKDLKPNAGKPKREQNKTANK